MKFLKSIKEGLKDPKKRSLTLLGLYAIFFIFVFIVISSAPSNPNPKLPEEENNNEVNNVDTNIIDGYEYLYKIGNDIVVTGIHKLDEDLFTYNGISYYKKDNIIYLSDSVVEDPEFDISKFSYETMSELIKESEFEQETTYKDGNKKTSYNINVQKYFTFLNEENLCDNDDCKNTFASIVVDTKDYINSIVIDLSSYYGNEYKIEINYTNINNIEEIKTSTPN